MLNFTMDCCKEKIFENHYSHSAPQFQMKGQAEKVTPERLLQTPVCRSGQKQPTSWFSVHWIAMTVLTDICFGWFRHIPNNDRIRTRWFWVPYWSLGFLSDANSMVHQFLFPVLLPLYLSSKIYIRTSSFFFLFIMLSLLNNSLHFY